MSSSIDLARAKVEKLCAEGKVAGAASDEVIRLAQAELGVKFPEEYIDILRKFGAVLAEGVEIYGLPDSSVSDHPLWNDVVAVTRRLRDLGQEGAEDRVFVAFSEDGTGVYFFFNTHASPRTEIWAIGPGVRKLVPGTLHEFISGLSERRILL